MKHQSIKNLFIAGLTLLSFGFLSAQFAVDSNINNALQVIQRVLVTTNGMFSGSVVMDTNTGNNNIYINTSYLPSALPYSGSYVLTLNNSGYVSLTNMTDFIQNNSFTANGTWTFGGDAVFNDSVTFNTGPVNFNDITTNFSGGTVNNTNNTINTSGSTVNNTNNTVTNNNVNTTNNGGTTTNINNIVNNSGTVINNTGVTTNNYSGTVTNYYTGSTIVYHSGTTVVFATGVVVTGAGIVWPQGPQGIQGPVWPQGPAGADGVGTPQNLYLNNNNILNIDDGSGVDLSESFWSLMGNQVSDVNKRLGTLNDHVLRIITNSIERITILWWDAIAGWYVWINNTTPEKRLHVNGAIASSLIRVSTWGTNIDIWWGTHNERFATGWANFISANRSWYYTPDGKAFFFPIPQDSSLFGEDDNFTTNFRQYIVFIDVQDVNTVILEPWENEMFLIWWFINGTTGQKLSVAQRNFMFDGSGVTKNISIWLPSPFFESAATGEIISSWWPQTLDELFSNITMRGSSISDSYVHFPSYTGLFDGWFYPSYNGAGDDESFMFQVLNIIWFCNLPFDDEEIEEDDVFGETGIATNRDDWIWSFCIRGNTYVYDGEYWLRTYGWI
jgi:hypothetical protein